MGANYPLFPNSALSSLLLEQAVWEKASPIPGYDPMVLRRDSRGNMIKRNARGKCSEYGWHIDHIVPLSLGGSDTLPNLQPLHWRNNLSKSDNFIG